jgi:threonine/homoserine/homoserine lactone efflux protein
MGQTIGEILPLAVGVAVSPIPIIAVILMLFSGRARANSLAFLVGWIVGIVAVCAFFVWLAGTQDLSSAGQPSTLSSWIKVALGVLLLLADLREWRGRPEPGADAKMPGWMQRIDSLKPGAALGLGFLLSAVNPKNLLLIVGAAVTIAQASLSTTDDAITIAVFTIIGASTTSRYRCSERWPRTLGSRTSRRTAGARRSLRVISWRATSCGRRRIRSSNGSRRQACPSEAGSR